MFEIFFQIANLWIMPFWLLMILLPHWSWSKRILGSLWIVAPLALVYTILVLPNTVGLFGALANPTPDGVAAFLGAPENAALGWIHFLAFDLFVGRWVYLDSRERNFSAWWVSPTLFLVFMFGPLGFLLYFLLRTAIRT